MNLGINYPSIVKPRDHRAGGRLRCKERTPQIGAKYEIPALGPQVQQVGSPGGSNSGVTDPDIELSQLLE